MNKFEIKDEVKKIFKEFLNKDREFPWLSELHLQIEMCDFLMKQKYVDKVIPEFPFVKKNKVDYIDILLIYKNTKVAIELKYKTSKLDGIKICGQSNISLKKHAAQNLVRASFVKDIERLEKYINSDKRVIDIDFGLFIGISNDKSIWSGTSRETNDKDVRFKDQDGKWRTLSGEIELKGKTYKNNSPMKKMFLKGQYIISDEDFKKKFNNLQGDNQFWGSIVIVEKN